MTIQEVEARTGLPRATVRYYEREGLLSPQRLENGYRDYSEDNITTLLRIKLLRELGIALEDRNQSQVSMNLTDYTRTSVYTAFEMVKMEARRYGVRVVGSEVVGIVPMQSLLDCAEYYLQIEDFSMDQVLESHL